MVNRSRDAPSGALIRRPSGNHRSKLLDALRRKGHFFNQRPRPELEMRQGYAKKCPHGPGQEDRADQRKYPLACFRHRSAFPPGPARHSTQQDYPQEVGYFLRTLSGADDGMAQVQFHITFRNSVPGEVIVKSPARTRAEPRRPLATSEVNGATRASMNSSRIRLSSYPEPTCGLQACRMRPCELTSSPTCEVCPTTQGRSREHRPMLTAMGRP